MFFLVFWRLSGATPQITRAQGRGVSWRPPSRDTRKIHYFGKAEALGSNPTGVYFSLLLQNFVTFGNIGEIYEINFYTNNYNDILAEWSKALA